MRARRACAAALLAGCALVSAAAHAQGGGDATRGAAKSLACTGCHGSGGALPLPETPSLAGQPETFLTLQMILFREGLRNVPAMQGLIAGLSEGDIVDIAAHFARQRPKFSTGARDEALFAQGERLSKRASCGGCHQPDYSGREQMPRLAGQREDYLFATMVAYRDNRRVGADTTMNGLLYGAADADLKALAHYFSQVK